jgi:sortase A
LPGKNILTLQSCTLPDYAKRLIVQAELIDTSEKAA